MGEAGFECQPATFDLKGYQLILCDQTLQSSWAQEQAQMRRKICNVTGCPEPGVIAGAGTQGLSGGRKTPIYMIVNGQGPWQIRGSSSA
jgi:hypothetical protein